MYLSLKKLAKKYDLHPDTIKKKPLIEGKHYIRIGSTLRYHIDNMHILLTSKQDDNNNSIDKFLV